jgi:D-glycero-D-manno-heptose 1,7-bisphosphate phosphatase
MSPNQSIPQGAPVDADGIWAQVLRPFSGRGRRPALFLDRDGVVLVEIGYLHTARETELIPGAAAVIARANACAVPVVLVTNQSGIGRGYFGWEEFAAVQDRTIELLAAEGASLDAVYACPHHPMATPPYDHADHPARKPNPGMLDRAAAALEIDLSRSWIVGDHTGDLEAGRNAGLAGGLHVLTGHGTHAGQREGSLALNGDDYRVFPVESVNDALTMVPLLG